ncbi:hypothetical protein B5P41_17065 [Bacillus sp. SRB_28]|nr:hypothetical protein B5P41_17065 [Bacillus sp. SRB_28]
MRKNCKRKFHFIPSQRLVEGKAKKKRSNQPQGPDWFRLIFCKNHAKEVSLYPVPTAGRGEREEEKGGPAVGTRLVQADLLQKTAKESFTLL